MRYALLLMGFWLLPISALAQEKMVTLHLTQTQTQTIIKALEQSGELRFTVPYFAAGAIINEIMRQANEPPKAADRAPAKD